MDVNHMKPLTKCEAQVMEIILSTGEHYCMQEILEIINTKYKKDWKAQTVSTFLARLVKKSYLTMKREGRTFFYYPTITLVQFQQQLLATCVYEGFSGQWDCAMNAMKECIKQQKDSADEVET